MNAVKKHAPTAARILMGLIFLVFGLNGFLNFIPQPELPAAAGGFMGGLASTGYFFPVLKGTEVIAGALLLSNRFVPLALTLLAAIVVQIGLFHTLLAPEGAPMAIALLLLEGYLGWAYRDSFAPMLRSAAKPAGHANLAPDSASSLTAPRPSPSV